MRCATLRRLFAQNRFKCFDHDGIDFLGRLCSLKRFTGFVYMRKTIQILPSIDFVSIRKYFIINQIVFFLYFSSGYSFASSFFSLQIFLVFTKTLITNRFTRYHQPYRSTMQKEKRNSKDFSQVTTLRFLNSFSHESLFLLTKRK